MKLTSEGVPNVSGSVLLPLLYALGSSQQERPPDRSKRPTRNALAIFCPLCR